jgi:hypothetical protein
MTWHVGWWWGQYICVDIILYFMTFRNNENNTTDINYNFSLYHHTASS